MGWSKKWLEENDINMYSRYIEGKSAVVERLIKTLRLNKICKPMTAVSKNTN